MKRTKFLIVGTSFAWGCLLAGCGGGGGSDASHTSPVAESGTTIPLLASGKWIVMGSSTAEGNGASVGKGWVALLQSALADRNIRIENIAKGGTTTYHGISAGSVPVPNRPAPDPTRNIDQALSRIPVAVLLAYPTNDTVLGYTVEETVGNIMSMRDVALAKGVPVLVLSTQPRNLTSAQLSQLQQINTRLAVSVGGCFVNVHQLLADLNDHLALPYDSGDGVHPNDAGHRVIANAVLETISRGTCFRI